MKNFRYLFVTLLFCLLLVGQASADLTDGLVAYYPFDGNANDASGNGYNGIEYGSPSYVTGQNNSALQLDGSSEYIQLQRKLPLTSFPISITTWVKVGSDQTDEQTLYVSDDWDHHWGDYKGISVILQPNGIVGAGYGQGGNRSRDMFVTSENVFSYNTWHNLTVVFSADDDVTIYIDGIEKESSDVNGYNSTGSFTYNTNITDRIGRARDGLNRHYFSGLIDEFRIYNRVLSVTEVQSLSGTSSCNDRYEEGKQYCINNPAACGINVGGDYESGWNDGKQYCISNPSACGIVADGATGSFPSYDIWTGILNIPYLQVGSDIYNIALEGPYNIKSLELQQVEQDQDLGTLLQGKWFLDLQETNWGRDTSLLPYYSGSFTEISGNSWHVRLLENGAIDMDIHTTFTDNGTTVSILREGQYQEVSVQFQDNNTKLIITWSNGEVEVWNKAE